MGRWASNNTFKSGQQTRIDRMRNSSMLPTAVSQTFGNPCTSANATIA